MHQFVTSKSVVSHWWFELVMTWLFIAEKVEYYTQIFLKPLLDHHFVYEINGQD